MTNRNQSLRRSAWGICSLAALAIALSGCASAPLQSAKDKSVSATRDETGSALRLARASRDAGDFASAINLYRSVLAMKPGDGLTIELGDTLIQAGLYDDAIDVYGRIGKQSDAYLAALLGLARANLALSTPSTALTFAEQAVAAAPQDPRAIIARAVSLDMLGRHAEAQDAYRGLLKTMPRNKAAQNDLALSLIMTHQFPEAVAILEPMARSPEASPEVRQNLALVYGLMGDDQRAAAIARTDLDDATTANNMRFYDYLRRATN